MMKVPYLDLKSQYLSLQSDIHEELNKVMESSEFAGGSFVARFEKEFAAFCDCRHAIGVGSGTEALWFSLLALGIGPGDEVITVPNTFIATAEAISFCGAKPVFVDIEEKTYGMDPALLEKAITNKTKAVIPVHIFGHPVHMDPILSIAKEHGLSVIEDACQAHGALYKGKRAGSMGAAGCFSFYPGKNLGAYGEAGAVVTNDPKINAMIRSMRDHGQSKKYYHDVLGWNGRMDGFQGAILSVKLKHLPRWNDQRRRHAHRYTQGLSSLKNVIVPIENKEAQHVYHIYAIRTKDRDTLMQYLQEKGIHCGIHYPIPIHLQKVYSHANHTQGSFPISETCATEFLSLPMYPELTEEQVSYVIDTINDFYRKKKGIQGDL
jgi:dTDP-4-amino-4,6-dideoxygalactose transaminase